MIGYSPDKVNPGVNWVHILSGACSGCATRFICQPFDVIKIRFQLQIEPISKSSLISKYRSIPQTVTQIVSEEGFNALWKGHISAQLLSAVYGMIQFSSFELYTQLVWNSFALNEERRRQKALNYQPVIHFVCGAMSGFSATLMAQPFDVIRTRIIAQSEPKTYTSTVNAFKTIIRSEGYRALFKGLVPTVVQIAPFTGIQFAVYNICSKVWIKVLTENSQKNNTNRKIYEINLQQSLCCGAISGMSAKLLVYPFDLIKKRLQVEGFQHARQRFGVVRSYSGTIDCIVKVWREEKLLAFYKGLSPSLLKAAVVTAFHFSFYEHIFRYLEQQRNN
jgi:solute carrier family 25 thiamine pyrophosphate transporter 19